MLNDGKGPMVPSKGVLQRYRAPETRQISICTPLDLQNRSCALALDEQRIAERLRLHGAVSRYLSPSSISVDSCGQLEGCLAIGEHDDRTGATESLQRSGALVFRRRGTVLFCQQTSTLGRVIIYFAVPFECMLQFGHSELFQGVARRRQAFVVTQEVEPDSV